MRIVFVYGTLLRNEPNHTLLEGSDFLGEAHTLPLYTLFDLGSFPAMAEGGETSVRGEVFRVSQEVLDSLDALEGHPDWYKRTQISLISGMLAEGYLIERSELKGRPVITSGDWRQRQRRQALGIH
jgi:gamma-glutamylaminecyclotransferase